MTEADTCRELVTPKLAAAGCWRYGFTPLQAQPSRLLVPMRLVARFLG